MHTTNRLFFKGFICGFFGFGQMHYHTLIYTLHHTAALVNKSLTYDVEQ